MDFEEFKTSKICIISKTIFLKSCHVLPITGINPCVGILIPIHKSIFVVFESVPEPWFDIFCLQTQVILTPLLNPPRRCSKLYSASFPSVSIILSVRLHLSQRCFFFSHLFFLTSSLPANFWHLQNVWSYESREEVLKEFSLLPKFQLRVMSRQVEMYNSK